MHLKCVIKVPSKTYLQMMISFLSRFQHTSRTSWKLQDTLGFTVPARNAKKGAKCISTQAGSEEVTCVFVNKSKTNMIFQKSL